MDIKYKISSSTNDHMKVQRFIPDSGTVLRVKTSRYFDVKRRDVSGNVYPEQHALIPYYALASERTYAKIHSKGHKALNVSS
jgi:hypothetical protein